MQFRSMFNPNMQFLAQRAPMNAFQNRAFQNRAFQAPVFQRPAFPTRAFPTRAFPSQAFPNQAFPNQAVEPIPTVTVGTGTCEEQLAYAGQIFYGLVSSYFAARDLLEQCRALVIAEGDTATDQELANALAFSGPGPQPALQPTAPCEDRLQVAQSLIRGLVDIFDNRFIPAMVLCYYFLRPRTDRPEASDLLNRMRNFLVTANATILGAARNFLPPIVR